MNHLSPAAAEIVSELEQSAHALDDAQQALDAAKVRYELGVQRYKAAFEYLRDVLSGGRGDVHDTRSLLRWLVENVHIDHVLHRHLYTGMTLGEALYAVLDWSRGEPRTLGQIMEALRQGGYQFQSTSPLREVNAALINLKGIEKVENAYALTDNDNG